MSVIITGLAGCLQAFKMLNAETRARVRDAVVETTVAVEGRAKANVPVSDESDRKAKNRPGPGELRDSIRSAFTLSGLTGYVLAGYGAYPRASRATKAAKLGPLKLKAFQRQQRRNTLRALSQIGVYAITEEYGSPARGIPGSRYMSRAKEAERSAHIARVQRALDGAVAAAGAVG